MVWNAIWDETYHVIWNVSYLCLVTLALVAQFVSSHSIEYIWPRSLVSSVNNRCCAQIICQICTPRAVPVYPLRAEYFVENINVYLFIFFSCDQAALWMVQSVRLSVCPSVRPSHLFDYVPIIVSSWNFQELLPMTKVTSMQKVKVRGQRSRSQRSTPNLTVSGL